MTLRYAAPSTLAEALALLAARGPDCTVIAGGMSVVPALKTGALATTTLVNIKFVDDRSVRTIAIAGDHIAIGALVRHHEVETAPAIARHLPALRALEETLASVQIRNCGTLVGNLCAAEPFYDPPALVAAAEGRLVLAGASGSRTVAAADWFRAAGRTACRPDELVLRLEIPLPREREGLGFARIAPRAGLARPLACAAARIALGADGRIARSRVYVGAVGPRPQRLQRVEAMLADGAYDRAAASEIDARVGDDLDYLADDRCGAAYKKDVAGVMVRRAVAAAIADARGRMS